MKVIIDNFIQYEERIVDSLEYKYQEVGIPKDVLLHNIEYHKSLVVILDVFKLLCCMVIDKLDYTQINEPEIISLIEETRLREIEKGSDA